MDLDIPPSLTIPAAELSWRFSRSSGPGGQHVNTTDSRAELTWNVAGSTTLTDEQRQLLLKRLGRKLIGGSITVTASEERSQLRNREIAMAKLAEIIRVGLVPESIRRASKPTRGSARRHRAAKEIRSATKQQRRRPAAE
ncbi:aminoacyl-tRNA hydrolase [Paenarthrobacter sp. MSM-2-10-13]|uniref:alternative ribosome rescue aminoacyl-tRNA hydrolase ArfB n=1 Tax=Micrococcaceae TaxID=1268 RepID=UPI00115F300A|nr:MULTISPECIES: alternative ribosome rescue aminoacyl-tRNA hydrolase ArfB [Micrococcaceae]MCM0615102.1 aminoacyl-tRNA hydrolase [Paenarthrobacter sp. TYUT067]NHW47975.1 aminoacyl-tRNA hydrolase [Paenarthrobacter sp. MSM-2-10-13]TQS91295.1 aminoacyl-tRNA hydrolase [Arthrobacter sp. TS-15]BCW63085.1 aminoacyl-tRNA hydrolase [Arthrobacter sp. StoSoilB22]